MTEETKQVLERVKAKLQKRHQRINTKPGEKCAGIRLGLLEAIKAVRQEMGGETP